MTNDDNVVSLTKVQARKAIHDIERMYRQADQIVGGFGAPGSFEANVEKRRNQALSKNELVSDKGERGPVLN